MLYLRIAQLGPAHHVVARVLLVLVLDVERGVVSCNGLGMVLLRWREHLPNLVTLGCRAPHFFLNSALSFAASACIALRSLDSDWSSF